MAVVTAVVLSAVALPAHAAPEGKVQGAGLPGCVGGSYLVTLKPGTPASAATARRLAEAYGARIGQIYGTVLHGFAVRADERQARRLAADPRVASVVQDTRVRLDASGGDPASWSPGRPGAPAPAGAGVTVYVIDTGVRITHEDFGGRASYGWDFVDGDRVASDGNGHGTHVAGIVAGALLGVARKAQVVAVRVLDDTGAGTTAQAVAGVDWVTRHAHRPAVANLSLGGGYSAALDAAVRASIRSGVTYTVAAGNAGQPAALHSPADVREAVTVGATDGRGARAGFSNYGSALDLFAPGVRITSASHLSDTGRVARSGTSTAAPRAAGAAALYLADHPRATPALVAKALVAGAADGKVSGRGPGSPDRLLRVPPST